jgi:hypothetical protein
LLVPSLLPRIAIVFAALWLARNLATDVQLMPAASALSAPFRAPLATSATAPGDNWQLSFKDLQGRLAATDDVAVQARDRDISGDAILWSASYWLFPHHVHLLTLGETPTSAVVVVVTSSAGSSPPAGYSRMVLSRTWPDGAVGAYRRD